ncbi:ribonuclease H2 subunit B, partial [Diaphorina citri]|uniref:Ribonuclease H2 subunit B n=1 Tax=Diaphorina citri TaxID=121845 RepID=A0A1S3DFQ9_DIACI
ATTLSPLDQTLVDREFPETRRLLKCLDAKLLSQVADRKDTYLRYAHGIVSEYLPPSLSSSLLSSLALPELKPTDPGSKRKLQVSQTLNMEDSEAKRIKLDTETLLSAEFKTEKATPNKPVQLSAKDKALARSASGTKPISSFFTRKPK